MYILRADTLRTLPPRAYLLTQTLDSAFSVLISGARCLSLHERWTVARLGQLAVQQPPASARPAPTPRTLGWRCMSPGRASRGGEPGGSRGTYYTSMVKYSSSRFASSTVALPYASSSTDTGTP